MPDAAVGESAAFMKVRRPRALVIAGVSVVVLVGLILGVWGIFGRSPRVRPSRGEAPASAPPPPVRAAAVEGEGVRPLVAPAPIDAGPPPPKWVTLTVRTVRVSPERPGGGTWDGPEPQENPDKGCRLFELVNFVSPGGGTALDAACGALTPEATQRQKDPAAPDLFVALTAGLEVNYRTYVVKDTYAYTFNYGFVVPVDGIPPAGLQIAVEDSDGDAESEQIGEFDLSRETILAAFRSPTQTIHLESPSVQKLDLVISKYDGSLRRKSLSYDLSKGPQAVAEIRIVAGEVVRVIATGSYSIGGQWGTTGPEGYVGGDGRDLLPEEPMASGAKGGAFASIRQGGAAHSVMVAPCVRLVARFSGPIWVGVNDTKPADNTGTLDFAVLARGPSVENWKNAGWQGDCPND